MSAVDADITGLQGGLDSCSHLARFGEPGAVEKGLNKREKEGSG